MWRELAPWGEPCAGSSSVAAVPVAKAAGAGAARSTAAVINRKADGAHGTPEDHGDCCPLALN
ncbi:hypothetical protein TRIUR3_33315 [Triticum urartu]|uniref:Uncharacterized protein n=1 Tax=Triticum urartu TaxID=4572 RepID=M7ZC06_TRIUA|nr:hypothetical protein TRIUR3_33315 [Triticum urartu]